MTDKPRSACSAVPHPMDGTAEQTAQASGTPHGTPAERTSLKALAYKVLRAEHTAEQTRNTTPATPLKSCSTWPSSGTADGTLAEITRQRGRLIAAAVAQGIDRSVIDRLDDADVDGCQWLDEPGLRRYAQIVQENHLRARGVYVLHPVAKPHHSAPAAPAHTVQSTPTTTTED